jgi:hypothetical protein
MRGRQLRSDEGAALAEAVIVTPVVVATVVALVVGSVLWRDQLAADEAAAVGARAAALHPTVHGATSSPDGAPLPAGTPLVAASVARALGGVPLGSVERVVVFGVTFGAETSSATVPTGCRDGSGPVEAEPCVVLGPEALADPGSVPGCGRGACVWRDSPGVQLVGVLVRLRHPGRLGALVAAPTIEAIALAPLEGAGDG